MGDDERVSEKLAAPIIKALVGKASVPDDSPYTTGNIGLLVTLPSQQALENCDTLLMVGTSFPYLEFLPNPSQRGGGAACCVSFFLAANFLQPVRPLSHP